MSRAHHGLVVVARFAVDVDLAAIQTHNAQGDGRTGRLRRFEMAALGGMWLALLAATLVLTGCAEIAIIDDKTTPIRPDLAKAQGALGGNCEAGVPIRNDLEWRRVLVKGRPLLDRFERRPNAPFRYYGDERDTTAQQEVAQLLEWVSAKCPGIARRLRRSVRLAAIRQQVNAMPGIRHLVNGAPRLTGCHDRGHDRLCRIKGPTGLRAVCFFPKRNTAIDGSCSRFEIPKDSAMKQGSP